LPKLALPAKFSQRSLFTLAHERQSKGLQQEHHSPISASQPEILTKKKKMPSVKPHPEDTFGAPESTWSNKPRSKMVKDDRAVLSSVVFPAPVATAEVGSTLFELFSSSICTGTSQTLFCFNNRERIK
jgi:hypothetical protein